MASGSLVTSVFGVEYNVALELNLKIQRVKG